MKLSGTERREAGLTWRSLLVGLAMVALVIELIHQAELVVGQRGHSAMANTSIPLGAFMGLLGVLLLNTAISRLWPRLALTRGEIIVVYAMMTTGTVIASSGGIHFLVPAIMAPYYFATPENHFAKLHPYIPRWFAPQREQVINDFYRGHAKVPLGDWVVPLVMWTAFLLAFLTCTLCLTALLRRQWVDRERLTFPTVVLPLEMTRFPRPAEGAASRSRGTEGRLWRNPVMWVGFALPFLIGTLNTLNANFPAVPRIQVRPTNISRYIVNRPWNAMGYVTISFYPFVLGIAFLLSLDVTFSCWFFYWLMNLEAVLGAAFGLRDVSAGGMRNFPFVAHQGAGAFLGLVAFSLWAGRRYWREVWQTAFTCRRMLDDEGEPLPYRWALLGLVASFGGMIFYCSQAGMHAWLAALVLGLSLAYMVAATRVRAETGNAWLFGPLVDPHTLITTGFGPGGIAPRDLTIMAYLRPLSTFDLRCLSMPHQLDAYKMADEVHLRPRRMAAAIFLSVAFAIPTALLLGLLIWYDLGAVGKAEPWRTIQGRRPFEEVVSFLYNPMRVERTGLWFTAGGFAFTLLLVGLRAAFIRFPFHPVGYALAGTNTMRTTWLPFFISWLVKSLLLRYGGIHLYRRALPFFLGLILGDFCNGGLYTIISCFSETMKVYPINW